MKTSNPQRITRMLFTGAVVLLAVVVAWLLYVRSVEDPWTRDGLVQAEVVKIAPQVSGPLLKVAVRDNQAVRKGDLLFQIDPTPFQLKVQAAQEQLNEARQNVKSLKAEVATAQSLIDQRKAEVKLAETERDRILLAAKTKAVSKVRVDVAVEQVVVKQAMVSSARASLDEAQQNLALGYVKIKSAEVSREQEKLKLSWTSIYAPSDGYVTNLQIDEGSYATAGTPMLAYVDTTSLRVDAYFKETHLGQIKPGNRAIVTLLSYPDKPVEGVVDSIGWAIAPPDIAQTEGVDYLVPQISPTFEWIRLAQRVPVRIHLLEVPEDVKLRVGTTASVQVMTGTSGSEKKRPAAAVPRAHQ